MNTLIISGSNRANSGSRKVADYIHQSLTEMSEQSEIIDMHELDLPMWSEELWSADSAQAQAWASTQEKLVQADALVIIAAEWNGTIPPSLHNFIMHLDRESVGHKPALLVGVSAGINGAYPIAELKSSASKNNRMLLVPDHLIIRNVSEDFDNSDHPIGPRIIQSLSELALYAKHMHALRAELKFDYHTFKNGM